MNKKTAFGMTGAAAAALLTVGAVAPAMADDHTSSSSNDTTSSVTKILGDTWTDVKTMVPTDVSPEVHIGDVGSGNAIGSGNDTNAPILSGNETAVGSGNDIGTNVSDLVDGSVGDITGNVSDLVGDATSSVDLGAILGD